jgi:HK97 gp10 family phage protein
MARVEFTGVGDMADIFDSLYNEIDEVAEDMLGAMGDVIALAQKRTASAMLHGKYYRGAVVASIQKSRVKRGKKGGKVMFVEFVGTQHGEDLSTIAYINEYGKTNQPARPFIATANAQAEETAVSKATAVLYGHYDRKGL